MSQEIYFQIGERKFYSDINARIHAHTTGQNITFHAYDDVYSQVDWTREPEQDWDWWCRQRAIDLRARYKHLVLMFTAGSDSSDILRIFLENNIPIDELLIYRHHNSPTRRFETDTMIIPMAKIYQQLMPGLRVTVHNIDRDLYEEWHGTPDWIEGSNVMSGQMNMGAYIFTWLNQRFCGSNDQNNTGYIMGLEKPKLIIEDGWWVNRLLDRIFDYIDLADNNINQFYYAPEMPEFFIKQCWNLVNYVEENFEHIDMTLMNQIYKHAGPMYHHYIAGTRRRIYNNMPSPEPVRNGSNKIQNLDDWGVQGLHARARDEGWRCYGLYKEITDHLETNHAYLFRDGKVKNGLIPLWTQGYRIKPVESRIKKGQ